MEPGPFEPTRRKMSQDALLVLILAAVFGGWFALQRWVLPRFGVRT
jgi:hypothetical protein